MMKEETCVRKGRGEEEEKKRKGKKDRKRKDKRTRKGRGSCPSSGRGKVKERTRRIGSFSGRGLFEQMGITKVSLGIWRISPLAYTQPCVKQIQTGALRMHRRITF